MHYRGKGVVGRLGAIDMVIRVDLLRPKLPSKDLNGAIRNDLVGVHV